MQISPSLSPLSVIIREFKFVIIIFFLLISMGETCRDLSVYVEIRGQLCGVSFLLPSLSEFLGSNSGQTCKASAFYPPSHLTTPHYLNVLITVLEILMQSQPVANSNRGLLSVTIKELPRPVSTFVSFKRNCL